MDATFKVEPIKFHTDLGLLYYALRINLMNHAKVIFFIGKGGVGKTTCSVATAVNLADKGLKVLLVSLDPAHNAGDALRLPLSDTKTAITPNLDAVEIDLERLMDRYLKHTAKTMKHTYRYLTVFNLENLLDVIRCSPGIEEYATLEALNEIIANDAEHYDVIIFDTAPTGLTLRVLALPAISLRWIEKLTEIRKKILSLRTSIEHIHGEQVFEVDGIKEKLASTEEEDKTMQELLGYHSETQQAHAVLTNPEMTSIVAVLNPEEMPLFETQRAAETLAKFEIPLKLIIINKVLRLRQVPPEIAFKIKKQDEMITKIHQTFSCQTILEETWQQEEPRGVEKLRQFSIASAEFFHKLMRKSCIIDTKQARISEDSRKISRLRMGAAIYAAMRSLLA
jgi:arsenite-transporting ATPase